MFVHVNEEGKEDGKEGECVWKDISRNDDDNDKEELKLMCKNYKEIY